MVSGAGGTINATISTLIIGSGIGGDGVGSHYCQFSVISLSVPIPAVTSQGKKSPLAAPAACCSCNGANQA